MCVHHYLEDHADTVPPPTFSLFSTTSFHPPLPPPHLILFHFSSLSRPISRLFAPCLVVTYQSYIQSTGGDRRRDGSIETDKEGVCICVLCVCVLANVCVIGVFSGLGQCGVEIQSKEASLCLHQNKPIPQTRYKGCHLLLPTQRVNTPTSQCFWLCIAISSVCKRTVYFKTQMLLIYLHNKVNICEEKESKNNSQSGLCQKVMLDTCQWNLV